MRTIKAQIDCTSGSCGMCVLRPNIGVVAPRCPLFPEKLVAIGTESYWRCQACKDAERGESTLAVSSFLVGSAANAVFALVFMAMTYISFSRVALVLAILFALLAIVLYATNALSRRERKK